MNPNITSRRFSDEMLCMLPQDRYPVKAIAPQARPDHERRMAFALLALEASMERRNATVHGTGMVNRPRLNSDPAAWCWKLEGFEQKGAGIWNKIICNTYIIYLCVRCVPFTT